MVWAPRAAGADPPPPTGGSAEVAREQPTGCSIVVHGLVRTSAVQPDGSVGERFLGSGSVMGEWLEGRGARGGGGSWAGAP